MARLKTTLRDSSGEPSSNPAEEPDMSEIAAQIERDLAEQRKVMLREAHEKLKEEKRKRDEEEAVKLRLEQEKEAEIERMKSLEEATKKRLEDLAQKERQKKRKRDAELKQSEVEKQKRRKQVVVDSDYEPDIEEMDEAEQLGDDDLQAKKGLQKKQSKQSNLTQSEIVAAFIKYGFLGTAYPDLETTKELGIQEDYVTLMRYCGLDKYVSKREPTYPEAAAEFLATVKYHEMQGKVFLETMGGGHINFQVLGEEYTMTLRQLEDLFGFPPGNPNPMHIDKEENQRVWKFLSGGDKFKSGVKGGNRIRSPTVAYARKAIAETFYSRTKTGPMSTGDLNILTIGLKKILGDNEIGDHPIVGDTAGAGLAYVLARHLETYRGKLLGSLAKATEVTSVCIGGPITAIMKAAGVVGIDWDAEIETPEHLPRIMNTEYLHQQALLAGSKHDPRLFYKFQFEGKEAVILLPNKDLTSFEDPYNIEFMPLEEFVIDPSTLGVTTALHSSERATASSSSKQKKATPATKGKGKIAPSLTTEQLEELEKQLVEKLRPQITAELTPVLIEQLTPVLIEKLTPAIIKQVTPMITAKFKKIEEHIGQMKRKRSEQSETFKLPSSHTGARPSPTSSVAAPRRPSTGSSSTPGPQKDPRHHSSAPGDVTPTPAAPQKAKHPVRVNISTPRNPTT